MFPTRYFGDRMFAPRYWPKVGAAPVVGAGTDAWSSMSGLDVGRNVNPWQSILWLLLMGVR